MNNGSIGAYNSVPAPQQIIQETEIQRALNNIDADLMSLSIKLDNLFGKLSPIVCEFPEKCENALGVPQESAFSPVGKNLVTYSKKIRDEINRIQYFTDNIAV